MNDDDSIVVALGSNLPGEYGSCEELLGAALAGLGEVGLTVLKHSRWWRSAAWPDPAGPTYRNGVALVGSGLAPAEVLKALFSVEQTFNRRRGARNEARTLDLDLIAYGRTVMDVGGLILPHPRAHERLFVMGPLSEIAPEWRHPILGKTALQLAATASVGQDAAPV
jgi:2-amino-4-hydroxy-6-hydroxymethyldihydropteridine diphosphokinase